MITPFLGIEQRSAPRGRLTLTTAVPVTTSDVTGASTLYFTPFNGNTLELYNGASWVMRKFTERSLALSGLTADKNYDVFLYDNAGTPALELSAAWTTDTARADALALQDGILVKDGAATRLYLGTFRSTATTTTEDSVAKRLLWNYYNPVHKPVRCQETTDSWTYTTATFRQKRASNTNEIRVVNGIAGRIIALTSLAISVNVGIVSRWNSIGMDSTSAKHADCVSGVTAFATIGGGVAKLTHATPLGYHYYAELEASDAGNTSTWYGDAGSTFFQSGMHGIWEC